MATVEETPAIVRTPSLLPHGGVYDSVADQLLDIQS